MCISDRYHIAVAGSLLGISLHQDVSYPVGKVNVINIFPMNFEEFLVAKGAVSYTHLFSELTPWQLAFLLSWDMQQMKEQDAVSYTHLYVYKRQVQAGACCC